MHAPTCWQLFDSNSSGHGDDTDDDNDNDGLGDGTQVSQNK